MKQCDCRLGVAQLVYGTALALVLGATAFYLGRRSAQAGLPEPARQAGFAARVMDAAMQHEDEDIFMPEQKDAQDAWAVINDDPRVQSTRTVLVQGPVTYLRKRQQPRYQPLADWGALVTAES